MRYAPGENPRVPSTSTENETDIHTAIAYVGSLVPDAPPFQNPAFSRAGNMFQENLLAGIINAGLTPSVVLSQRTVRAFPNSPHLFLGRGKASLPSGLLLKFIPFINLPFLRPITVGLAVVSELIRWAWKYRDRPRVVYTFNLTEPPGLFTLLGARLTGSKAIVSMNDINVPGETVPASLPRRLDFWLQKRLISKFDGIVVVNRNIIEDFAPKVPFIRVEGGVREQVLDSYSPDRIDVGKHGRPFTFVSAGSLDEANGFIELLEAFTMLSGDNYRLHIAGVGPLEGKVREAAKDDPRITYHGYLPFDCVLALYQTADVLVNMRLTKRVNTRYFFPSKMMEYLASGVPVLTTCTGHVEQEWGDIAFLLKEESAHGLASALEHVASLDPTVLAAKGRMARAYMQEHCTWDVQGRRIGEFIRALVINH